ncbi:MAG TPA: DUF4375 domain-containing protein [Thermoanaerobaculia bacterium]
MYDFDYVLDVISPWIDKYIDRGPGSLSSRELIGVAVWMLDVEVNNGGFLQYYSNSRGCLAEQTVGALEIIGAPDTAALLRAANKEIPFFPLPEDRDDRFALLDQVAEQARFAALETEYYLEREDRIHLLAQYLRATSDT